MRPSSGSRKVLLAAALILAGCSSSSDTGPGTGPGGDVGVGRSMAKLDAGPDSARDGLDDAASGGGVDSPAVDLAGDGGDAPSSQPTVTVEVDLRSLVPQQDGGVPEPLIVPSTYGPSPYVTVTVVSRTGDLKLDEISTVTAAIYDPLVAAPLSSTKLARSDSRITPESDTMQFVFSGVPLDLSKLASASYNVLFTATTVGGATGQTRIVLAVDSGPSLTVRLPVEGGFYKGSAPVEVQATQTKFTISQVTMALGQREATPLTSTGSGIYKGTIDFGAFSPPLEGAQLATFRGTNENGTETTVLRKFTVDSEGPSIGGTSPGMGAMVGNVIVIKATVSDQAGVDDASVIAVVGNGDQNFEVVLSHQGGSAYSSLFDTTKLPSFALYPTISFRARDRLGNESTTSYMLSLDNEPPLMDLDPPYVRRFKEEGGKSICSWPFDPVGPDTVDDGDLVTQLFDVRARIEDRGNNPLTGEADFVLIGGIDAATVKLYVLGNANRPLVVDTSDPPDEYCDDINPELVPTTRPQTDLDAQVLDMLSMGPTGAADFSPNPDTSCSSKSGDPPKAFCETTYNPSKALWGSDGRAHSDSMTSVIAYSNNLPAIYTLGPIGSDKMQCAGRQFDSSNNLKNGWACLAVKASDNLGNTQVSRPIRVCVVSNPTEKGCADLRPLARLIPGASVEVITSTPFLVAGAPLAAGSEVLITGVTSDPYANGRWIVDPVDSEGTRFTLRGAVDHGPTMCVCGDEVCASYLACSPYSLGLQLTAGQPIVVTTKVAHGLVTGDIIEISGNTEQAGVAGVPWPISVVDETHFTLVGSTATEPVSPGGAMFVITEKMPDCTGTLVTGGADGGRPLVDGSKPCKPWTHKGSFTHR